MSDNGHADDRDVVCSALGRYEGQLTRYARRITGDAERARDVVQETFLRLCSDGPSPLPHSQGERGSQSSIEDESRLVKWLFTVCRNYALDVRRKESRMTMLVEPCLAESMSDEPSPAECCARRDEAERVQRFVDELPPNQRDVIRMKFQQGMSYQEISEATGHTVSNVGFLIHSGLKTIRARVKQS